jgi:hypothetical protein
MATYPPLQYYNYSSLCRKNENLQNRLKIYVAVNLDLTLIPIRTLRIIDAVTNNNLFHSVSLVEGITDVVPI